MRTVQFASKPRLIGGPALFENAFNLDRTAVPSLVRIKPDSCGVSHMAVSVIRTIEGPG
jgi:hypothetical protein